MVVPTISTETLAGTGSTAAWRGSYLRWWRRRHGIQRRPHLPERCAYGDVVDGGSGDDLASVDFKDRVRANWWAWQRRRWSALEGPPPSPRHATLPTSFGRPSRKAIGLRIPPFGYYFPVFDELAEVVAHRARACPRELLSLGVGDRSEPQNERAWASSTQYFLLLAHHASPSTRAFSHELRNAPRGSSRSTKRTKSGRRS
jgi:hypothetical protein